MPAAVVTEADFEQLYRDHVDDARRLAAILVGQEHAEELVAESFARVWAQVRAGRGPSSNFRAYLHVTIRNGFRDILRATREAPVSDQPWLLDEEQPPVDQLVEDLEAGTAAHAFATLPETWQKVLWHVEVEGRKPAEVADLLGMRAGAVSSLAHRAREGLRRAYLDQHVTPLTAVAGCGWTRNRLSQYVRADLSPRAEQKVAAHLDGCGECLAAYLQVERVNRKLAAWIFPVVLLGALPASGKAVAWLAGLTGLPLAASGGGTPPPASGGTNTTAVAAAAAAVVAVGVGGLALAVGSQGPDEPRNGAPATSEAVAEEDPAPQPPAPSSRPRAVERAPRARPPVVEETVAPAVGGTTTSAPPRDAAPAPGPIPTPPPTRAPAPVVVQAVAPRTRPVGACDTYGEVVLPTTRGVSYALTSGDGLSGPWTVEARAESGYVLRAGTTTTFSGDLGAFEPCTRLAAVAVAESGSPAGTSWAVTVVPDVNGGPTRTITAQIAFDADITVPPGSVEGEGWVCEGSELTTCTFAYAGAAPPSLTVRVLADPAPSGTVTLFSDGTEVGSLAFAG